jgi:hypothetical protein
MEGSVRKRRAIDGSAYAMLGGITDEGTNLVGKKPATVRKPRLISELQPRNITYRQIIFPFPCVNGCTK